MDLSTLNRAALGRLPTYKLPATYHLQECPGNGCAGDPPGYPSYFTRDVYTRRGASPRQGPCQVIAMADVLYVTMAAQDDADYEQWRLRLRGLWSPLPLDHERTRLWILDCYREHARCYNGHGDDMVIWPVPNWRLRQVPDHPGWSDEYRKAKIEEVGAWNRQIEGLAVLATPDNHNAVRLVRHYYPDYRPEAALIDHPPDRNVGDWWRTEARQPAEKDCAGTQSWGHTHPFNGTWCQWCGRYYGGA